MNFSEVLRLSGGLLSWSPNGSYCAVAITARLEIRDARSLQTVCTFNCIDAVQYVEWSPDSQYILTCNYKRSIAEAWSLEKPEWRCKIDEGSAGLIKICWAPDSRHILTTADFHLRITVWSLVNKSVSYIKNPKNCAYGMEFSPDHDYLVVAERHECKDFLTVLETKSWQMIKHFEVGTRDLTGVRWAMDSTTMVVWESPLEYKVLIYSLSGSCLSSYSAYQWALGVKCLTWSPSGQFLAIGSYDQKVRLMNNITWRVIAEFPHDALVESLDVAVYKEVEKPLTGYPATLAAVQGLPTVLETTYEEEHLRPVSLASIAVEPSGKPQANPRLGVGVMQFSSDNRYLATRNDNMPSTLWIWTVTKLQLKAVCVHTNPVKAFAWDPKQSRLAVCTGNNYVYFWSPFGCLTVAVPAASSLQITGLKWHPSGRQVALLGGSQFSVCNLESQQQQENTLNNTPGS
ncbi:unnamed protein product, partial [Meganyctiphanes norvegica]